MLRAACLALAAACCACTSASGSGPAGRAGGAGQHGAVITVGSFDFPESVLLADLYAGALAAQRFPARVLPDLGPRELVDPALMSGLVQVVPEYSGSALEFISVGRLSATSDTAPTSKFWVQGTPNGESWEIYTVLADSPTFYGEGHGPGCCGGPGGHTEAAAQPGAACC